MFRKALDEPIVLVLVVSQWNLLPQLGDKLVYNNHDFVSLAVTYSQVPLYDENYFCFSFIIISLFVIPFMASVLCITFYSITCDNTLCEIGY